MFDKTLFLKLEIIPHIDNIRQLISHVIELSDVLPEAECVILVTPKDLVDETDLSRSLQRLGLSYFYIRFIPINPQYLIFYDLGFTPLGMIMICLVFQLTNKNLRTKILAIQSDPLVMIMICLVFQSSPSKK